MKQINPTPIECKTAGEAMQVIERARKHCLSASYHPQGGETARRNIPVRHFVWVCGTVENFNSFRSFRSFRVRTVKRSAA